MKKVVLLYHSTKLHGPIDLLNKYLKEKKYKVYSINHPLDNYKNRSTIIKFNGKSIVIPRINNIFNLFLDLFINIYWLSKINLNDSTIIGANNFDTLSAILFKLFFRKKVKIIYFAADYSENRFNNYILDNIYLYIEKLVLKHGNLIVSNTKRAQKERIKLGMPTKKSIVIPNAIDIVNYKENNEQINKSKFIYVGNVTIEHGLFDFIKKIKVLINELTIIGDGPEMTKIKVYCNDYGIKLNHISYMTHGEVLKYLTKHKGLGLAPYNNNSKWTYYCSPLKVIEYISCGVPVVMSNLPEISKEVSSKKLGVVYDIKNKENIVKLIEEYNISAYYKKSSAFLKDYNYKNLYDNITI